MNVDGENERETETERESRWSQLSCPNRESEGYNSNNDKTQLQLSKGMVQEAWNSSGCDSRWNLEGVILPSSVQLL